MSKLDILVTGGAGFIGSVTCALLQRNGYNIVIIDDLRDGNLQAISKETKFYQGNFGDFNLLNKIFSENKFDCVFHFAASANVPDSVVNPSEYYLNNVVNTITLLNTMRKFNVSNIIFSSTAAVYGDPKYVPIDESHPLEPINPYGFSKLFIEQVISDYAIAYGIRFIIFRYFCAAGATKSRGESRKHETHLIPVILDTILQKRESVTVYGTDFATVDGSGIRDYIHVEDIAYAHILGMDKLLRPVDANKVINLGTRKGYSVLEVIGATESLFNIKVNYTIGNRRTGDPAELIASNEFAKEYLDWLPKYSLNDIILSAFEWRKSPKY